MRMKPLLVLVCCLASMPWAVGADAKQDSPDKYRPLRLYQTVPPNFPRSLLDKGVLNGFARVVIDVDVAGLLTDWLVVGYSRREFSESAVAAVRQWNFDPLIVNGQPMPSQVLLSFDFEAKGVVISMRPDIPLLERLSPAMFDQHYGPCTLRDLDGIPEPTTALKAPYPADLLKRGIRGTVVVEFYIDETGAVRMPAVLSADFPELGDLAADAVRHWSFAPPTRQGKPVLVHARQVFNFGGDEN